MSDTGRFSSEWLARNPLAAALLAGAKRGDDAAPSDDDRNEPRAAGEFDQRGLDPDDGGGRAFDPPVVELSDVERADADQTAIAPVEAASAENAPADDDSAHVPTSGDRPGGDLAGDSPSVGALVREALARSAQARHLIAWDPPDESDEPELTEDDLALPPLQFAPRVTSPSVPVPSASLPPTSAPAASASPSTRPNERDATRPPAPVMRYAAPWESVQIDAPTTESPAEDRPGDADGGRSAGPNDLPAQWTDPWNVRATPPSGEAELLARDAAPVGFGAVHVTVAPPYVPEPPEEELEDEEIPTHPDDDEIVQTLADWLAETRAEAAALAETEGDESGDVGDREDRGDDWPPGLARSEGIALERGSLLDDVAAAGPGLVKLVEEFTALRHDVKLQTKSARGQGENVEALVANLRKAIETFQTTPSREEAAVTAALRPLFEALVDLDSSFDRGRVAAENARNRVLDPALFQAAVETEFAGLSFWKKKLLGGVPHTLAEKLHAVAAQAWSTSLDAQVDGYRMIQNRLRRFLKKNQVEKIETVGVPVDPNTMTVIDVGDHPTLPPGAVMDELRAGYRWRGQVLRFAEVKAVRARPTASVSPAEATSRSDADENDTNQHDTDENEPDE